MSLSLIIVLIERYAFLHIGTLCYPSSNHIFLLIFCNSDTHSQDDDDGVDLVPALPMESRKCIYIYIFFSSSSFRVTGPSINDKWSDR